MTFEEAFERVTDRVQTGCPDPKCSACKLNRDALEVLKKEGESRAAEMRERAAGLLSQFASAHGKSLEGMRRGTDEYYLIETKSEVLEGAAEYIRALPLTEAKGNG